MGESATAGYFLVVGCKKCLIEREREEERISTIFSDQISTGKVRTMEVGWC